MVVRHRGRGLSEGAERKRERDSDQGDREEDHRDRNAGSSGNENPWPLRTRGEDETRETYQRLLRLDRNKLDQAWEDHPDLMQRVGDQLALAISRRDAAKMEHELKEAECSDELRRSKTGDDKLTDKAIERRVSLMPAVKRAYDAYLDARLEAARWQALEKAFDQRGTALKSMSSLYVSGYFSIMSGGVERNAALSRQADRNREAANEARGEFENQGGRHSSKDD